MDASDFRIRLFAKARTTTAYRKILAKHKIRFAHLSSESEFKRLPVLDKTSYIKAFKPKELYANGKFPALAYASSGSSGAPTFWFREPEQERVGAKMHEDLLRAFGIKKNEPTLVIISFAMGIWIAGHYTMAAFRRLAEDGYNLSIITPALEKEDTIRILQQLAPQFEHVIIAGYPPFLMDLMHSVTERRVTLPESLKLLASGDKFTEEWRATIAKMAGINDSARSVLNVYGSADTTVLGHETPLSVFIRQAAHKNKKMRESLFGEEQSLSGIIQFDPALVYFEELSGEIVVTAQTAAPLIRYNLHDRGSVVSYEAMVALLDEYGLKGEATKHGLREWKRPFVFLNGRTDVAVTFYALNIYPEHVQACAHVKGLESILSGNYLAYTKSFRHERDEKLFFEFELKEGARATSKQEEFAEQHALHTLISLSTEFRRLYGDLNDRAKPHVSLIPWGALAIPKRARGLLAMKGKKPKIVLS